MRMRDKVALMGMNNRRMRSVVAAGICLGVAVSTGAVLPDHPLSFRSRAPITSGVASDTADTDWRDLKPTPWDATGWKGRVVIGEYATGIACVNCKFHDYMFATLLHRYPATAFIELAYHGGLPWPIEDRTDSKNWWERTEWWDDLDDWYGQMPIMNTSKEFSGWPYKPGLFRTGEKYDDWIDGHATDDTLTTKYVSFEKRINNIYDAMVRAIDSDLRKAPEAVLQVQATPHGGTISTRVTVKSLAEGREKIYVRILLVQDTVPLKVVLPKKDGDLHNDPTRQDFYMVVRGAAHTAKYSLGVPLDGPGTVHYTFDVAEHQRQLLRVRKQAATAKDRDFYDTYPEQDWRIDPARLHVVAMVQDAVTGDILQAQMVPVQRPHGAKLHLP